VTTHGLVTRTLFVDAVRSAVAAVSLHNSQPWRFRYDPDTGAVEVRADRSRALKVTDPSGWGVRVALGAATYNLMLAFAVARQPMEVTWQPSNTDPDLHALLVPGPARPPTNEQECLYHAIGRRYSNRAPFRPEPVPLHARTQIVRAAREELAWVELVTGVAPVAAVAEITRAAQQVLERDPAYLAELRSWSRDDPGSPDGVPLWTSGHNTAPQDLFPQRPFGDRPRPPGRDYETEPLVAVLGTTGDLAIDHLHAGYALQRVLLTITDLGLSCAMLSQPIEVPSAREQLRLALGRFGTPQMVLRIGYGVPGARSSRRPPEEVIDA
jgi:nitroreductase